MLQEFYIGFLRYEDSMEKLTTYQKSVIKQLSTFHHRTWVEPGILASSLAKPPKTIEKKLLELVPPGLVEDQTSVKGDKGYRLSKSGRDLARKI